MKKYYFRDDDELCYTIEGHKDIMRFNEEKEIEVFEAKIDRGLGYFYCHEYGEVGESGESCGKQCDGYSPRNGKSGICKRVFF